MRHLVGSERAPGARPLGVRAAALGVGRDVRCVEGAVDDQLAAALEQAGEARAPGRAVEPILLVDRHPRHPPALRRHGVAGPGELLLLHQQLLACCLPLVR